MEHPLAVSVADAKKRFSELLGRVEYGEATVVVTKRGRPVARLVAADTARTSLKSLKGWLDDDDPFLAAIDEIASSRSQHQERPVRLRRGARK